MIRPLRMTTGCQKKTKGKNQDSSVMEELGAFMKKATHNKQKIFPIQGLIEDSVGYCQLLEEKRKNSTCARFVHLQSDQNGGGI